MVDIQAKVSNHKFLTNLWLPSKPLALHPSSQIIITSNHNKIKANSRTTILKTQLSKLTIGSNSTAKTDRIPTRIELYSIIMKIK